jgi:thioredoxin reductase (NADPH)
VCNKVTIVQNLPFFTGEKKLAEALESKENVQVHFSTLVDGYLTEQGNLTGVQVKDEAGKTWSIPADGVFLAVGLQPENGAFGELAQLDDRGYFDTDEFCVTKTAGLFVAGDCRRKQIRQVTTAAADGAVAAMAACRYLEQ